MTDLKQLLAFNIKQNRHKLGLSQARLAEKADASTQYIAMLELGRKFPSTEMLGRLASAMDIDNLDFFSPPPFSAGALKKLQKTVLDDLEKSIARTVNKAVREATSMAIAKYTMDEKERKTTKIRNKKRGIRN